jgi:hypothetical protein
VALDVVIVDQFAGEVIFSVAGMATVKSKYFHVIVLLSESNIVTVNLYLQEERSFKVKFQEVDLDVQL